VRAVGPAAFGPGAPLQVLAEPSWWDGERPLLELLREVYGAVQAVSTQALLRLPAAPDPEVEAGGADGAGSSTPEAGDPSPVAAADQALSAAPGSAATAVAQGPQAGEGRAGDAAVPPRARPLMLPGLAAALGVDPLVAAPVRGRRRR
jgi:hypothetical protein